MYQNKRFCWIEMKSLNSGEECIATPSHIERCAWCISFYGRTCMRARKQIIARMHRLFPRFRRAAESKEVDQMESALFASMLLFILIFFGQCCIAINECMISPVNANCRVIDCFVWWNECAIPIVRYLMFCGLSWIISESALHDPYMCDDIYTNAHEYPYATRTFFQPPAPGYVWCRSVPVQHTNNAGSKGCW